jgi:OOP family OmpA-OmpF porin
MKLNRIALAVILTAPLSVAVHADTSSFTDSLGLTGNTGLGLSVTGLAGYQGFAKKSQHEYIQPKPPYDQGYKPYGAFLWGVAVGYELTPSLAVEAQYNEARGEGSVKPPSTWASGHVDKRVRSIEGNFLLNSDFITHDYDGKFKPYVLVGAGFQQLKARSNNANGDRFNLISNDTIANFGVGAFYRVTDALALRVEGRGVENVDHSLLDWKAFAGLQVTLGGHKRPYVAPPAPAPEPAPAPIPAPAPAPEPAPAPQVETLKLELRVFFDTNKSNIKAQYQPEIAKVADKLKEFSNASAEIKGYTDSRGSRKLNDRLSQARAESVKASLVKDYGVDGGRLTAKGYSWDDPVASNKTPEGRALNRRVVAVITGTRTVQ